jgi:hypothetical protein
MHKHRMQPDGQLRASDNWQQGIPRDAYMKSAWRHFFDWWAGARGVGIARDTIEEAICALLFNAMGYLHEHLKAERQPERIRFQELGAFTEKAVTPGFLPESTRTNRTIRTTRAT